jgi:fumarate hydratase class I
MDRFKQSVHELIVETSTNLAPDVRRALLAALAQEAPGSRAELALRAIALNVDMAADRCGPVCQDTGMLTFEVKCPVGADQLAMSEAIAEAVTEATAAGKLRPNSVDPLTGRNSGTNLGPGTPVVHFEQWLSDDVELRLILKGGGSENVSAQYSLPCELSPLGRADRDLRGVRKCVLHAVHSAQGRGCSVGIVGVAIGGDRGTGHAFAKQQLLRPLDDVNADASLAQLESEIVREGNALGIGSMGFGGKVTLVGCKIGALNRLPASFFVSVAYDCWALRRLGVRLDGRTGAIERWLYREEGAPPRMASQAGLPVTGREIRLETPLNEYATRSLRVGDVVLLSGVIHTGRDRLHQHLTTQVVPLDLQGHVLYHCGPVALREGGGWRITAAGPTTSSREEPYESEVIRRFGIRAVIGKGGMGERTLRALRDCGAVYLSAIGGAAQFYVDCIEEVLGVDFLDFGIPEAMWHLRVRDFPAIVTMDSHGHSLHRVIEEESALELESLA